jgi:hypothetical protein
MLPYCKVHGHGIIAVCPMHANDIHLAKDWMFIALAFDRANASTGIVSWVTMGIAYVSILFCAGSISDNVFGHATRLSVFRSHTLAYSDCSPQR